MNPLPRLLSRVLLTAAALMAIAIILHPMRRGNLETCLERALGSNVSIESARSDLLAGQLHLKNVSIDDPLQSGLSWLQADEVSLAFDAERLRHRQLVVDQGSIRGLQIGMDGRQDTSVGEGVTLVRGDVDWQREQWSKGLQVARSILRQNLSAMKLEAPDPEWTVVVAKKEWQAKLESAFRGHRQAAGQLQAQLAALQTTLESPSGNPLRASWFSGEMSDRVTRLEHDWNQARQIVGELRELKAEALDALDRAASSDQQTLERLHRQSYVDRRSLGELLIDPESSARIDEVLDWVRWLRAALPESPGASTPSRFGVDVHYGATGGPDVLLKSVDIEGAGTFGGQWIGFAGTAQNIGYPASQLRDVSRLTLATGGTIPWAIEAKLDRRTPQKSDRIRLVSQPWNAPSLTLGHPECLTIDVSPSTASAEADLQLGTNSISGRIRVQHTDCDLRLRGTAPELGALASAKELTDKLATIDRFQTEIKFSGSLTNIEVQATSNLANQLSTAMIRSSERNHQIVLDHNLALLAQTLRTAKSDLDRSFESMLNEWTQALERDHQRFAELRRLLPDGDGLRQIR